MIKIHRRLALLALSTLPLLIGACSMSGAKHPDATQREGAQDSSSPSGQQEKRGGRHIDFAAAAKKLGVSEADLKKDLGVADDSTNASGKSGSPGARHRLDIPGAATKLGVTKEKLIEALGIHPRNQSDHNQPNQSGES